MLDVHAGFRGEARRARGVGRLAWPVAAAVILLLSAGCWLAVLLAARLLAGF